MDQMASSLADTEHILLDTARLSVGDAFPSEAEVLIMIVVFLAPWQGGTTNVALRRRRRGC